MGKFPQWKQYSEHLGKPKVGINKQWSCDMLLMTAFWWLGNIGNIEEGKGRADDETVADLHAWFIVSYHAKVTYCMKGNITPSSCRTQLTCHSSLLDDPDRVDTYFLKFHNILNKHTHNIAIHTSTWTGLNCFLIVLWTSLPTNKSYTFFVHFHRLQASACKMCLENLLQKRNHL